jgi:hypothetical protein
MTIFLEIIISTTILLKVKQAVELTAWSSVPENVFPMAKEESVFSPSSPDSPLNSLFSAPFDSKAGHQIPHSRRLLEETPQAWHYSY